MKFDAKNGRRSIRLKGYDYGQEGIYFITICAENRAHVFGEITNGELRLNVAGKMIAKCWSELPNRFAFLTVDEFVIMPNHFHGIIHIVKPPPEHPYPLKQVSAMNNPDQPSGQAQGQPLQNDHPIVGAPLVGAQTNGNATGSKHPKITIGNIIGAFKSITTHEYILGVKNQNWPPFTKKLWQRNYYEHIIRNEESLFFIRQYILCNPKNWEIDKLLSSRKLPQ